MKTLNVYFDKDSGSETWVPKSLADNLAEAIENIQNAVDRYEAADIARAALKEYRK